MRKSMKIATVAAVLFLALGAVAYVYACSQNGLSATTDGQTQTDIQNMETFLASQNITFPDNETLPYRVRGMPQMREGGLEGFEMFLQNATLSTVQGTVVSEARGMLILNTGSGEIRVLLPRDWTVGSEVVDRVSLFNGTFASAGQSVTMKVLESDVLSNSNFSINVMMGYEAVNATGTQAYAVLPFNIQANS